MVEEDKEFANKEELEELVCEMYVREIQARGMEAGGGIHEKLGKKWREQNIPKLREHIESFHISEDSVKKLKEEILNSIIRYYNIMSEATYCDDCEHMLPFDDITDESDQNSILSSGFHKLQSSEEINHCEIYREGMRAISTPKSSQEIAKIKQRLESLKPFFDFTHDFSIYDLEISEPSVCSYFVRGGEVHKNVYKQETQIATQLLQELRGGKNDS